MFVLMTSVNAVGLSVLLSKFYHYQMHHTNSSIALSSRHYGHQQFLVPGIDPCTHSSIVYRGYNSHHSPVYNQDPMNVYSNHLTT